MSDRLLPRPVPATAPSPHPAAPSGARFGNRSGTTGPGRVAGGRVAWGRVAGGLVAGGLVAWGLATPGLAQSVPPLSLQLPLECPTAMSCEIIKYVDNDPGPGIRDYSCGRRTGGENNYASTSFAIRNGKAMRRGVNVVAAAAGTVEKTRDGMADTGIFGTETLEQLTKIGCGNAVVLGHPGGWRTIYCHLRQGSVKVKPGETVKAGQTLAMVGMSGLTELPHLYFSVRMGDTPVDPFVGAPRRDGCGLGSPPLWTPDVLSRFPYKAVLLRDGGFAAEPPDKRKAREGLYPEEALPRATGRLHFWLDFMGADSGDSLSLRLFDPAGKELSHGRITFDKPFAQNFIVGHADPPAGGWGAGVYRGIATMTHGEQAFTLERKITLK